jgi:hypothetical protein
VTGREPDDWAAGNRSREVPGKYSVVRSVPLPGFSRCGAVPLAALIPSPCPGCWPGGMGRVRVREGRSGGVNHRDAHAGKSWRRRVTGDLAPGRWPGKAVHAGRAGGSGRCPARQRICPSRMP